MKTSKSILEKYPDMVPVVIEKSKHSKLPEPKKSKFLVPVGMTFGMVLYKFRKDMHPALEEHQAVFYFVNSKMPALSTEMGTLYEQNKDFDGFLYVEFSEENVFG